LLRLLTAVVGICPTIGDDAAEVRLLGNPEIARYLRMPDRDPDRIHSPVIGFIFDQKGLIYNLTPEGSKISRIQR
jgi:hypothetical protein